LKSVKRDKIVVVGQAASTQRTLDRPEAEDAMHFFRPEPSNWEADKYSWNVFDLDQILVAEDIRHKGRNSLADAVSQGASSVTQESKDRAVSAFTCSPAADIEEVSTRAITGLKKIESDLPVIKAKASFKDKLLEWLKPKKQEIDKKSIAYILYKAQGGRDEDFK
jgi:hypothetical protein